MKKLAITLVAIAVASVTAFAGCTDCGCRSDSTKSGKCPQCSCGGPKK